MDARRTNGVTRNAGSAAVAEGDERGNTGPESNEGMRNRTRQTAHECATEQHDASVAARAAVSTRARQHADSVHRSRSPRIRASQISYGVRGVVQRVAAEVLHVARIGFCHAQPQWCVVWRLSATPQGDRSLRALLVHLCCAGLTPLLCRRCTEPPPTRHPASPSPQRAQRTLLPAAPAALPTAPDDHGKRVGMRGRARRQGQQHRASEHAQSSRAEHSAERRVQRELGAVDAHCTSRIIALCLRAMDAAAVLHWRCRVMPARRSRQQRTRRNSQPCRPKQPKWVSATRAQAGVVVRRR